MGVATGKHFTRRHTTLTQGRTAGCCPISDTSTQEDVEHLAHRSVLRVSHSPITLLTPCPNRAHARYSVGPSGALKIVQVCLVYEHGNDWEATVFRVSEVAMLLVHVLDSIVGIILLTSNEVLIAAVDVSFIVLNVLARITEPQQLHSAHTQNDMSRPVGLFLTRHDAHQEHEGADHPHKMSSLTAIPS